MKNSNFFSLINTINYQEGSVVSRELFRNGSGTLTLFAFDTNQGLSEHKTAFEAFATVIDGQAEIIVDGEKYEVKQGEMLHMPANKPHSLKAHAPFKMLLLMMK